MPEAERRRRAPPSQIQITFTLRAKDQFSKEREGERDAGGRAAGRREAVARGGRWSAAAREPREGAAARAGAAGGAEAGAASSARPRAGREGAMAGRRVMLHGPGLGGRPASQPRSRGPEGAPRSCRRSGTRSLAQTARGGEMPPREAGLGVHARSRALEGPSQTLWPPLPQGQPSPAAARTGRDAEPGPPPPCALVPEAPSTSQKMTLCARERQVGEADQREPTSPQLPFRE